MTGGTDGGPIRTEYVVMLVRKELAERAVPRLDRHFQDLARQTGSRVHPDLIELTAEMAGGLNRPAAVLVELSVAQTAARLGCSAQWVRALCRAEKLPARRAGRDWLIQLPEVA